MLFDNIELRVRQNKLSGRLISQAQFNTDKAVINFFKKNQTSFIQGVKLQEDIFRKKLNSLKSGGKSLAFFSKKQSEDSFAAAESNLDDYDDEYDSELDINIYDQQLSGQNLKIPNKRRDQKQKIEDEDINEQHYALDYAAVKNQNTDFDYDEYMRQESRRKQSNNPSAQYFLKTNEMKKIQAGTYKYKTKLEVPEDDDDVMYGVVANLSDQEEDEM